VCCHRSPTTTCDRSNPVVGRSWDNEVPTERDATRPRGRRVAASIKAARTLGVDDRANPGELLINAVKTNKPKVLIGLTQQGTVSRRWGSSLPSRSHPRAPADR